MSHSLHGFGISIFQNSILFQRYVPQDLKDKKLVIKIFFVVIEVVIQVLKINKISESLPESHSDSPVGMTFVLLLHAELRNFKPVEGA